MSFVKSVIRYIFYSSTSALLLCNLALISFSTTTSKSSSSTSGSGFGFGFGFDSVFINAFSPNGNVNIHHKYNHNHHPSSSSSRSLAFTFNFQSSISLSPSAASSSSSSSTSSASLFSSSTKLEAVKKSQTAIYDGAEYVSILGYLMTEDNPRIGLADTNTNANADNDNDNDNKRFMITIDADDNNNNNDAPMKKAGYITFVTGTLPQSSDNKIVIAVQAPSPTTTTTTTTTTISKFTEEQEEVVEKEGQNNDNNSSEITVLDETNNVHVYTDSIAVIPNGISINDAISTASAALCGVHCGLSEKGRKTVILGGGDYACFTAKALSDGLGMDVNLVTTRPMSLKDTPLNPLRGSKVNAMSPSIIKEDDDEEIGFSEALGQFDTCIDTLGDEAKMSRVRTVQDGIDRFCGNVGVAAKLAQQNQCKRYISTMTKSQQFVLKEGILFARDPVLDYQKKVEKDKELIAMVGSSSYKGGTNDNGSNYQMLPPPRNYGNTLEALFKKRIIYPTDKNENGGHGNKKVFVRGCSFPDYTEIKVWPQDSTDGAAVRFGFPGIQELTLEARMDTMMGAFDKNRQKQSPNGSGVAADTNSADQNKAPKKKKKQQNPFIIEIESLSDITEEIRNTKKDAVLFVSAPYCRLCRAIGPLYNRMARISNEELNSDVQFAKAVTGTSKAMKQLTFTLQIDSVPTFLLFREGERFGEPFGVTKLPSVKLNRAIECLKTGKEWDPEIMNIDEGGAKMRTKI